MYKSMKRILTVLTVAVSLYLNSPVAAAMPDILPLAEVTAGMEGTLYTVVDPSGDIVSFDAQILGVYQTDGSSLPYIIARSEGAFADTDGGLMQGMSGSPVYVDGLLIGAASATLSDMNPHTFLITPIEYMLPLWDMPDMKNRRRPAVIDIKKAAEEHAKAEAERRAKEEVAAPDGAEKSGGASAESADKPAETIRLLDMVRSKQDKESPAQGEKVGVGIGDEPASPESAKEGET